MAAWIAPHPATAQAVVLEGSSVFNMAVPAEHQAEVEALAGQALTVVVNKSRMGLQALLDHRASLAMMSSTPGDQIRLPATPEIGQATPPFQVYLGTRSLVVLVVHPSNPLRSLGIDQLRRVLSGDDLDLVSLGQPTTVMMRVIAACREIAAKDDL